MKPTKYYMGDTWHGKAYTRCASRKISFDITGKMIEQAVYWLLSLDNKVNKGTVIAEIESTLHQTGMSSFYEFWSQTCLDDYETEIEKYGIDSDEIMPYILDSWNIWLKSQETARRLFPEFFVLYTTPGPIK